MQRHPAVIDLAAVDNPVVGRDHDPAFRTTP